MVVKCPNVDCGLVSVTWSLYYHVILIHVHSNQNGEWILVSVWDDPQHQGAT